MDTLDERANGGKVIAFGWYGGKFSHLRRKANPGNSNRYSWRQSYDR